LSNGVGLTRGGATSAFDKSFDSLGERHMSCWV